MRFFISASRVGSRTCQQSSSVRSCSRSFAQSGGASTAKEDAHGQHRFYSLGEYLQRLPRGIRDLLLWSPAIAMSYFVLYKQAVYFVPSVRLQLLSRPVSTVTTTAASSSSGGSSNDAQKSDALPVVHIRKDDAFKTVVDGVLLHVVDDNSHDDAVVGTSTSSVVPPFRTGPMPMDAMSLRVVREASTGKICGYTLV